MGPDSVLGCSALAVVCIREAILRLCSLMRADAAPACLTLPGGSAGASAVLKAILGSFMTTGDTSVGAGAGRSAKATRVPLLGPWEKAAYWALAPGEGNPRGRGSEGKGLCKGPWKSGYC